MHLENYKQVIIRAHVLGGKDKSLVVVLLCGTSVFYCPDKRRYLFFVHRETLKILLRHKELVKEILKRNNIGNQQCFVRNYNYER